MNRRRFALGLGSALVGAALAPKFVLAQANHPATPVKASSTDAKTVTDWVTDFFKRADAGDTSIMNDVIQKGWGLFFASPTADGAAAYISKMAPPKLQKVKNIMTDAQSSVFTVDLIHVGWDTKFTWHTQKWWLTPTSNGGFQVTGLVTLPPDTLGRKTDKLSIKLSSGKITLGSEKLPMAELLVVDVNADQQPLTAGLYQLSSGKTVAQAAAQSDNEGLVYLGGTPVVDPTGKATYAFLLPKEAAGTYMAQEFLLDANNNIQPTPGGPVAVGFTVAK